jgi:hypothetical protein
MIIYLSHPFTGDPAENMAHATKLARELCKRYTVFSPLHVFSFVGPTQKSYDEIMQDCYILLSKCDRLVYCGMSKGVDLEIKRAKMWGIPVIRYEDL